MSREVVEDTGRRRFELREGDTVVGWSEYLPAGEDVIVAHTEIDPAREGEGLGSELVRAMLDRFRERGQGVIPTCPFTAAWIARHPDYVDVVTPSLRERFRA